MVAVKYPLWLIFFILALVDIIISLTCNHRPLNISEIFTGIKIDTPLIKNKYSRPPYSNIRIHFEYAESYISYPESETIKKDVLLPAKSQLESLIYVKNPVNGILRVDRTCKYGRRVMTYSGDIGCSESCVETKCVGVAVPPKFLKRCKFQSQSGRFEFSGEDGKGVIGIDIALIVVVQSCPKGVLAAAASCFQEDQLDRPILGILIICHGEIKVGEKIRTSMAIIQHEVIHALGFSAGKYAFYRNRDGTPKVPRNVWKLPKFGFDYNVRAYVWTDDIVKRILRERHSINGRYNKNTYAFTLPTVLDVARKHFNCPSLDGVDLSNAPSHFDEYILYNELMTPMANGAMTKLSKFSLALLKDTGWYDVKMDGVSGFHYSENKGCDIVMKGCYKYMTDQKAKGLSISPFCDKPMGYGKLFDCSENRKFFFYCDFGKVKSLDSKYQYFRHIPNVPDKDARRYSGSSKEYEYCPSRVIIPDPNSICDDATNDAEKNGVNVLNSYYGKDSACFENGIWYHDAEAYYGASCQKFFFDSSKNVLIVYFKKKTVYCPSNTIYWFAAKYGHTATFSCPNINKFKLTMGNSSGFNSSPPLVIGTTLGTFYFTIMIFKICDFYLKML